ncbi:MAG: VWA-like domain-containing protein, partial [Firmicutes bacterium]|nr:VWA-like domain-containing protein [Bacillota bacterium]
MPTVTKDLVVVGGGPEAAAVREARGVLLACGTKVTFMACDTAVHQLAEVKRWQDFTKLLKGGGGTDFRPAFEAVKKLKRKPDVVVF